jgi:hypothetical protein
MIAARAMSPASAKAMVAGVMRRLDDVASVMARDLSRRVRNVKSGERRICC